MLPLPKIALLLSSIICLLFSSCAISKYGKPQTENPLPYWELNSCVYYKSLEKYQTTIDILKNHLSGILLVKQTNNDTTCITFINELGMKYFDFIATADSVTASYVFEPLNKPAIVSVLKNNFANMFLLNFKIETKPTKNSYVLQKIQEKNNQHTFLYTLNKQKKYFTTGYDDRARNFFILKQETFKGKKLSSRIKYHYSVEYKVYETISCTQYGLVKFRFNLERMSEHSERLY